MQVSNTAAHSANVIILSVCVCVCSSVSVCEHWDVMSL